VDDLTLLKKYTAEGSEDAFGKLVARHVAMVYSAARRQVGDSLAADVTQAVFLLLARKAAKLSNHAVLTAWLLTTTRLVCHATLRKETRRQQREQEAAAMPKFEIEAETQAAWEQVQPMLDEALVALSQADRNLVVLRFFEQKSHAEIAQALGLSEVASKKRLSRAVERLRAFFGRRGVVLGAVALLTAISQNAIQSAPVGLDSAIKATIAVGTGAGMVTSLVNTTQKLMTWTKIKIALLCGTAALLVTVVPLVAMSSDTNVVSDPDHRDAKLERYAFHNGEVTFKLPPALNTGQVWVSSPPFPGENLLSAEFSWKIGQAFPAVSYVRLLTSDENGNGYDPVANNLNFVNRGDRQYWVQDASVFPRRGKEVRFRLIQDQITIAECKIPNPAPGTYPTWTGSPLPASSSKEGLEVTLHQFAAYQTSPEFSAKHPAYFPRTECEFAISENGHATKDWTPVAFEVSDATGNHWRAWLCNPMGMVEAGHIRSAFMGALWPGESAWKLQVEFKRKANFPEAELLRIPKIRIPDVNEAEEPQTGYEQNGVNIELAGVIGANAPQATRPPLANAKRSAGCITVALHGPVVSEGRRMTFVSATDDQGRDFKLVDQGTPATAADEKAPVPFSFVFSAPQGAKELNLVVAISQSRTVEFLAKPVQVLEEEGLR
jgi:RNA polymerase sigma factor (sigma-70 family)